MKKRELFISSGDAVGGIFPKMTRLAGFLVLLVLTGQATYASNLTATEPSAQTAVQKKKFQLKGKVLDENKQPVSGATIVVASANEGAIADVTGSFVINVTEGDELEVSFIGMKTVTQKVTGSSQNVIIELPADAIKVDDVVVVGYGTTSVKDLTGSVARIGAKEIGIKNVSGTAALLQNMASGVMVSQPSGRPGEPSRIRVRGATSLTGSNNPLYVIDGVPTDDSAMFDAIPPSDISSIDVLKDASASAIYGSRAANGVILVTTKRGSTNSKASFNVDYGASLDTQIKNFRMLKGDEYRSYLSGLAIQTQRYDPANKTAQLILDPNSGYVGTANTDWFEEVKQPAWRHNLNVSASGGSKAISYYISGSIQDQKGMVKGDDMTRYVGRVNIDANISKSLKLGAKITSTYIDQNESGTSLHEAQNYRPDLPIYNADGTYHYNGGANPVAKLNRVANKDAFRFLGTIYGELEIIKGLKLKSSLSANQSMNYTYIFTPSYLNGDKMATASQNDSRGFTTVWDNTLTYNQQFGKHSVDALAGVSFENNENQSLYLSKKGYALDDIYTNVTGGTEYSSASDTKNGRGLLSSFFRLNYKYNDKYLATFTARYDGSSMFGKNNRYGFFPSGALAWRINKESFLESVSAIDDLKLKASVGRTGVQNMTSYANRDLYKTASYNGKPGIVHSQIGNPDIEWEQSTLYDVALDYSFFKQRLSGSVGYYVKDTEGLIWSYAFPSSMAVGQMSRNIGAVRNQGVEFNVKGVLIEKQDLALNVSLNISHNRNRVTKLESDGAVKDYNGTLIHGNGTSQVLAVGHPMGSFYGYEYHGIIQNEEQVKLLNKYAAAASGDNSKLYDGNKLFPGMLAYKDLNGDGTINSNDQTLLGSPDPDLFGGLMIQFRYKRMTADMDFGFQIGGKKQYSRALQNVPAQLGGLVDYNLNNTWSPDNTSSKIPVRYLEEGTARTSKMLLYDASFIRLQNLRINYELPKAAKLNMRSSLFVSATNLFTITKYPGLDPATVNSGGNYGGNYDGGYPGVRTFSFGAKLNF